jgi:hypothetical protein
MKAMKTIIPKLSDSELVTQHIQKLEPALGKIIETILKFI